MARKVFPKKQLKVGLAELQKKVIDSINQEKKNLEDLTSQRKVYEREFGEFENKLITLKKEVPQLEEAIKKKKDIIANLDVQLTNANNELKRDLEKKKLEEQKKLDKYLASEKERVYKDIEGVENQHNALLQQILASDEEKKKLELEIKNLEKDLSLIRTNILANNEEVKKLKDIVAREKSEILTLEKSLNILKIDIANLDSLKREVDSLEKKRSFYMAEITVLSDKHSKLEKEREDRLGVVIKRESELLAREKNLEKASNILEEKEKKITKLGTTLQRHLDKLGMSHIKVFEE